MTIPQVPTLEDLPAGKGVPLHTDESLTDFIEREYLMRGVGSVYAYGSDFDEVVEAETGRSYATRVLTRWPADPTAFSGTVVIDVAHPEVGIGTMWWLASRHIRRRGHGYVMITTRRNTLAYGEATTISALRDHDPERYAPIDFEEGGSSWDAMAQLATLVRAPGSALPSAASKVLMGGYSGAGAYTLMFSRSFHDRWQGLHGGPVVDGYLVGEPSWYQQLSSLDDRVPEDDQAVRDLDVPVISIYTQSQRLIDHMVGCGPVRIRDDRDSGATAGVRTWEIAGSAHGRGPGCGCPASDLDLSHYFHLALDSLAQWSDGGAPAPRAERIELEDTPDENGAPRVRLDQHGNVVGGVRSVKLDVPVARHYVCREAGAAGAVMEAFTPEKLAQLYGDHAGYRAAATQRSAELVEQRWLLDEDAPQVLEEADAFGGFTA